MGKTKNPQEIEKFRERRKKYKQILKEKRARLVVKNLPFDTTKEDLLTHFGSFGDIEEVTLLRKPDGSLIGCGFVQFKLVQKAAKARHHTNGKPFKGRDIICDFALPKKKFEKKSEQEEVVIKTEIKQEPIDPDDVTENVEINTDLNSSDVVIKEENILDEDINHDDDNNDDEDDDDDDEDDKEIVYEEQTDDSKSDVEEKSSSEEVEIEVNEKSKQNEQKKPHVVSNDVSEGKTIFVKNIPYSATNEELHECMSQFGPLHYALICIDKMTEHSKGTGFVKFKNQGDAEKCLQAGTELKLLGSVLDCHKALNRSEIHSKTHEKAETKQRDSRNLYLIKEGVILAGSKAAERVSASDMAKRLQLEQYKNQVLRNLNMFISKYRLIIHNLPANWDDSKLRALFKKHSDKGAIIKEARIMRDLRDLDSKGIGRSKEYGFITFAKHEHALQALRSLNNNPNVFSANKRPIVAFSIENRAVLNVKEKRMLNSKLKNPKCKNYNSNGIKMEEKSSTRRKRKHNEISNGSAQEQSKFAGVTAKPGSKIKKMRSRHNLKSQAMIHREQLKKEKKKQKFAKKTLKEKQKDYIRQPQQKKNNSKKKDDDGFSKLVNSYKQKLLSGSSNVKSKWYE